MKHFLSLALALALALLVTACAGGADIAPADEPTASFSTPTATDAAEGDGVIATVGTEKISFSELKAMFDTYKADYESQGYDVSASDDALASFRNFVANQLINKKLIIYMAKELGYAELSPAEESELAAEVDAAVSTLDSFYRASAESAAANDPSINVDEYVKELIAEEAERYTGEAMDYDAYIEWLTGSFRDNYISQLLYDATLEDVAVAAEDVAAYHADNIAAHEARYTGDPAAYRADMEAFEAGNGAPPLFVPEGYSRITHILIRPEGALSESYTGIKAELAELSAEYGRLSLLSDTGSRDRAAAVKEQYDAKAAEADAMLQSYLSTARERADEAYTKLSAGESFTAVMAEYTEDAAFAENGVYAQRGRLISLVHAAAPDWSDAVKDEFSKLSVGEYSPVFGDESGCHIICYVSDEPAGPRSEADAYEDIAAVLLTQFRADAWSAAVSGWYTKAAITVNEALIAKIG